MRLMRKRVDIGIWRKFNYLKSREREWLDEYATRMSKSLSDG